jgi:uncharacterized hydrophobic protein (TIGR00271 family)
MRQLLISVPRGEGRQAVAIANAHRASNVVLVAGDSEDGPIDAVLVHLPNNRVESLIGDLQRLSDLRITITPRGVIPLQPPQSEAADQAVDVGHRSPIEIFLAGLQSIGSWRGFLSYAAAAGIVVWVGMITNTVYLLVAAMLIAPFAGPAMNLALGTSRGDATLIRQSTLRYFTALLVTAGVCAVCSLLFQQEVATSQMVDVSQISAAAALLPLAAGAAGALNLVQSERSSLVSGAAVGMLVAASLAPPAALVGMGAAIGEWDLAKSGAFLLLLQLAGINISGTLVFRFFGLSAHGTRYARGQRRLFPMMLAASAAALAALVAYQLSTSPGLQRATRSQRAAAEIQTLVNGSGRARLVEATVRFTRADIPGQNTLLAVVYVQPASADSPEQLRSDLTAAIQQRLLGQEFDVTPLVDVIVLDPPAR